MSIIGLSSMALAGTPSKVSPTAACASVAQLTIPDEKSSFSGSFNVLYATEYVGRGLLVSEQGLQHDGSASAVLRMREDFSKTWAMEMVIAYTYANDENTLFELDKLGLSLPSQNIENELIVKTGGVYSNGNFSMGFGHNFVHGGIFGAMSKHFADKSNSSINELYIEPKYCITPWMSVGTGIRYSIVGVKGWWFEPNVTFQAPIIGTPEDVKLAAILAFHLSATGDYFQAKHGASTNGAQAFWIKLSTPWFVTDKKNFIITPSVSFNWLGSGGIHANKNAETRKHFGEKYVPFKNFGVVGSIMATYTF